MMACHFCPYHIRPEYAVRSLKDHLGPTFATLSRPGQGYALKLGGAPVYEIVSDGSNRVPRLRFDASTLKRSVYYMTDRPREADLTESRIKQSLRNWYIAKTNDYHSRAGDPSKLPGAAV